MTPANRLQHHDLMPAINLRREVAGRAAQRQQMRRSDNNFALGNAKAVDGPTVYDADDSGSEVSANRRIHDVVRQANHVRHRRLSVQHSHSQPLPHKVRASSCTLSRSRHNQNRLRAARYRYRPSYVFQNCNYLAGIQPSGERVPHDLGNWNACGQRHSNSPVQLGGRG